MAWSSLCNLDSPRTCSDFCLCLRCACAIMPALTVSCHVDSQASGKVQDSIPVAAIICWYVSRRYSLPYNKLFITIKMMQKGGKLLHT